MDIKIIKQFEKTMTQLGFEKDDATSYWLKYSDLEVELGENDVTIYYSDADYIATKAVIKLEGNWDAFLIETLEGILEYY